jgi:hypothetical protein
MELQQYKRMNGHCSPTKNYKAESGAALGKWVQTQRQIKDRLSLEKVAKLEALCFVWDPLTEQWEQGFSDLQAFAEREGHCNVLRTYNTKNGSNLGTWVQSQRKAKSRLSTDQITRLNSLGFAWDPRTDQWENGLEELKAYKAHEGHCNVPSRHRSLTGYAIGNWVIRQRVDRDKGVLTAEQISILSALGFTWDLSAERWELGFSHFLQFIQREGHSKVLSRYLTDDGFTLGGWVLTQRKDKAKLPPERLQRLDDVGFIWDASKGKPNDQ